MPYPRPRRYVKRRVARRRKARKAPLIKRVNKIQRSLNQQRQTHYCYHQVGALNLSNDYSSLNLTNYNKLMNSSSDSGPLFGSSSFDFDNVNKVIHHSTTVQYTVDVANEVDNVQLTIMVLSLRSNARSLYDPSTSPGSLGIADGPHFRKVGGMAMVNKQLFKVHYIKNLNIGNNNTAVTSSTADNGLYRLYTGWFKIKPRTYVTNPGIVTATGDVDVLYGDLNPTKQYYLVVFNNNSGADSQFPTITCNQITKFITF